MVVSEDARGSSAVVNTVSGCDEEAVLVEEGEEDWSPNSKGGGAFMRQGGGSRQEETCGIRTITE